VYEETIVTPKTGSTRLLGFAIVFLVISILSVVLYGLLAGVLNAPAPRTLVEASAAQAEAQLAKTPGSGRAWAALAASRWASGDRAGAYRALEEAASVVTDHSILFVHTAELDFLLAEGRNEEAHEKAVEYVKAEEEYRVKEAAELLSRGIKQTEGYFDYGETVRLYVLKAAIEGNLEKWEDAVKTLDFALKLDDKAADVITLRGWAKLQSGDAEGAAADFRQALKYIPDYASAKEGLDAAIAAGAADKSE
jgi:tetratricopeptide (TPR) repeat protein